MSRIGKNPVAVPKEVKVNLSSTLVSLEGPNGKLDLAIPHGIVVKQEDSNLVVSCESSSKQARCNFGTIRSRINCMVQGVTKGHKKDLEIQGIGFRAELKGKVIHFNLGFSHPVEFEVPEEVKVSVPNQTTLSVEGADKVHVGQVAAKIRGLKPAEPYKGKGIRYAGEIIRRKQGKSVTK